LLLVLDQHLVEFDAVGGLVAPATNSASRE
jgi:hypothetical protein